MRRLLIAAFVAVVAAAPFAQSATETLVVTPSNTRGWTTADTRPGGTVTFVEDLSAPGGGTGALQLTTTSSATAKAQYMHPSTSTLADVTDLAYSSKQNSAAFFGGAPSYQLAVNLCPNEAHLSFTTFVFEPYQNGGVTPGVWQSWDVTTGSMWSSRSVSCATGSVSAGFGGAPFYTLAGLQATFPNAVVIGFGVNIGSNNPSYNVEADLVRFNETIYDFEVFSVATDPDECKKGGWSTFNPPGGPYKNQGQCVSATVPQ